VDRINDIQVLCHAARGNRRGKLEPYFARITESAGCPSEVWWHRVRVKDKVMQIKNNYDKSVFIGDIGFIQSIDLENARY
jgi:exodeoxyribonuclease V alpha subunit